MECGCRFCSTKCCDLDIWLLAGQAPGARPLTSYLSLVRRYLFNAPLLRFIHHPFMAVKDIPAETVISLMPLDGFLGTASPVYGDAITLKEAVEFRFNMLPDALVNESCMNTIVRGSYSNPRNVSRDH